jgi:hypothetical protein
MKFVIALVGMLWATSYLESYADDEKAAPLQGSVDEQAPLEPSKSPALTPMEPLAVPVVPARPKKPLQGTVEHSGRRAPLETGASEEETALKEMQAIDDKRKKDLLKGAAALDKDALTKEDPDAEDQELMVAWDTWRNKFLWSIQSNMQEEMNNPDDANLRWDPEHQVLLAKFPLGISAWFSCQVSADRHITSYKLVRSSGYPNYDKAVAASVKSLEGSSILKFPARSRRQIVTQVAGIKTSETGERKYQHFGDVERYTMPGQ